MRLAIISVLGAVCLTAACAPMQIVADADAAALPGRWRSVGLEHYGNHHATRSFEFTDQDWQVTYQAWADAQGRQPLFTIRVQGGYTLGEASAKVDGAREGVFPARSRRLSADSDAGVQLFASMGCTLVKGQVVALVNTGCGFVPGVMQVMGEYDLVAFRQGQLYLGDRGGDLSKARPAKLTPYPLLRQH